MISHIYWFIIGRLLYHKRNSANTKSGGSQHFMMFFYMHQRGFVFNLLFDLDGWLVKPRLNSGLTFGSLCLSGYKRRWVFTEVFNEVFHMDFPFGHKPLCKVLTLILMVIIVWLSAWGPYFTLLLIEPKAKNERKLWKRKRVIDHQPMLFLFFISKLYNLFSYIVLFMALKNTQGQRYQLPYTDTKLFRKS